MTVVVNVLTCEACGNDFEVGADRLDRFGRLPPRLKRCDDCRSEARREQTRKAQARRRRRQRSNGAAPPRSQERDPERQSPPTRSAMSLELRLGLSEIAERASTRGTTEAERVRLALAALREHGVSAQLAWELATDGRPSEALEFARSAFERAYCGEPETTLDRCARQLGAVLEMLSEPDDGRVPRRRHDLLFTGAGGG